METVLRHRKRGKRVEYLCSWRHFPLSHASWVKERDLNAPRLVKEYHERTARKIAYLNGEEIDFPTRYNRQPNAGSAKMAARPDDHVSAIHAGLDDSLGPSRAHDEPVFARHDNTAPALEAWISSLEQVLQVSAIAPSGHPRDRLRSRLKRASRQRQKRLTKPPRERPPNASGIAPPDLEMKMEFVAMARALEATRVRASRVGRSVPEEADPGEINYQLKRMWREVRASVKRAGTSVSARRAIWRRVSEEARRAAEAELRSATPQRRPFPKHSPEKPSRPARRTRPRAGQGGRRRS